MRTHVRWFIHSSWNHSHP